jgi:tetratricopeptide (TPR) repeat protein
MYLSGSKWSMNKRKRHSNPWRVIVLALFVGMMVYFNARVVPNIQPIGIPTPTVTRSPDSFVNEAETYLADGKTSLAIASYKNAILADPKNVSNYIKLARLYVYTGKYEEAATEAENALLLNSNNSMALAIRGWALGLNGDYLEANDSLKSAITYDPNNGTAFAYYAEILALQQQSGQDEIGTLDQAIEYSQKAVEKNPGAMETHRARGLVLEITSNYEEAAAEFEAAIAQDGDIADLHIALGRNYRVLERYEDAVSEFIRANALNPSDYLPEYYISRTYASIGDFVKAIQFGEEAIIDSPADPYLYGNLGVLYYRYKQYNRSIDSLRLAIQGGTTADGVIVEGLPLDYGTISELYYVYGLALARQGECNEALQIAQTLVQIVPDDVYAVANAEEINTMCSIEAGKPNTPFPTSTGEAGQTVEAGQIEETVQTEETPVPETE